MKVYFAGPDVFYPDYPGRLARLKALAEGWGLEPLFPGDVEEKDPLAIAASNFDMIKMAEALIANLNPFRGQEPDSGTVFECGYAAALGKPVFGYLRDRRDALAKLRDWPEGPPPDGAACRDGSLAEDFGLPLNLMLATSLKGLFGDVEEAAEAASQWRDEEIP